MKYLIADKRTNVFGDIVKPFQKMLVASFLVSALRYYNAAEQLQFAHQYKEDAFFVLR